jgi:hypothetical protein
MRRFLSLLVVCLVAGAAGACHPETIIATEDIPTAGVRFINAVPDTAGAYGLDMRFVDITENSAQFRITFRNNPSAAAGGGVGSSQVEYKPSRAGSRHFVIFLDDSLQAVTQIKLKDTTVTLTAGKNYTAILWGQARAGGSPAMKLTFFEEAVPDPGTQVALRVINATAGAIDVTQYVKGAALPGTPTWSSVAAMSISSYVTAAPGTIMYNVRAAGSATNMFTDIQALLGVAASSSAGTSTLDIAPIPGTAIAGSAVTLVVFPASVPGTRVPQTNAFLVPAGSFIWDRRPPNPTGT